MDKTPGQVIYESTPHYWPWETLDASLKEECEIEAAAVIAHVCPQIEAEARAVAIEDVCKLADSPIWANFDDLFSKIRAVATLPPGHVVVPVERLAYWRTTMKYFEYEPWRNAMDEKAGECASEMQAMLAARTK